MTAQSRWRAILDVTAAVAMIVAAVGVVWLMLTVPDALAGQRPAANAGGAPLPSRPVSIEGAAVKGKIGVRVGVIEYSDFQCPYCGTFARDTLPRIVSEYVDTGKAFFAFRHLPLEAIHPHARRAAEAAECARRQDRFWTVHDTIFRSPDVFEKFDPAALGVSGMDIGRFSSCLTGEAATAIQRDLREAQSLGIRGTPTFLFGVVDETGKGLRVVRRESGAIPYDAFAAILDEALDAAPGAQSRRR